MKKSTKKLSLNKETLKLLDGNDLGGVRGGLDLQLYQQYIAIRTKTWVTCHGTCYQLPLAIQIDLARRGGYIQM